MNESIACEPRREKHTQLHEAIQDLDGIARHLDELIEKVTGPTPETGEPTNSKEPQPTLSDILNGGADAIRTKTETAHRQIERLKELLF